MPGVGIAVVRVGPGMHFLHYHTAGQNCANRGNLPAVDYRHVAHYIEGHIYSGAASDCQRHQRAEIELHTHCHSDLNARCTAECRSQPDA